MKLKIKKVKDKIELDVKAQQLWPTCDVDCLVWYRYSAAAFKSSGYASGCYQQHTKQYTSWW